MHNKNVPMLRGKLGRGAVEHEFYCEHSTTRTDLYIYQGVIGDLPCIPPTTTTATYLPIAGPSGAVKTGPTYLLHRVERVPTDPLSG